MLNFMTKYNKNFNPCKLTFLVDLSLLFVNEFEIRIRLASK